MENRDQRAGKAKTPKNKGKSERIGRLNEQTHGYYRRVTETLQSGFDTDEEKELFLSNVFKELSAEALVVSRNQSVSNTVELLLRQGNRDHLEEFMNAVSKDWELACSDRFMCHVTQTLITRISPYLTKEKSKTASSKPDNEGRQSIKNLFVELWMYLMDQLAVHMQHTYTSHIIRVMLEVSAGVPVSEQVIRSRMSWKHAQGSEKSNVKKLSKPSQDIIELFYQMSDRITEFPKLADHVKNPLSNPVLQTMILILAKRDPAKCAAVCQQLISQTAMFAQPEGKEDSLAELLTHEVGSHLVEQLLSVLPTQLYDQVLDLLSEQLVTMAMHPTANFVLQSLIGQVHNKSQFKNVFKKLSPHMEGILSKNHMRVIVRLAEGAVKHGAMQDKLVKALMKAFHCYKPEERQIKCFPLIASLSTHDTFYKQQEGSEEDSTEEELGNVNIHGSILLQNLFKFGNPKTVVTSLLELKPSELRFVSCDACGCHAMDAFMKSEQVGEKSKSQLAARLKGHYFRLATTKYGSRTFDTLWSQIDLKSQLQIAEELVKDSSRLRGDQFGRYIWRNCALEHFERNQAQWKDLQKGAAKKHKMFADIVGGGKETDSGSPTKKKKKSQEAADSNHGNSLLLEDSDTEQSGVIDTTEMFKVKKQKTVTETEETEEDNLVMDTTTSEKSNVKSKKKKKRSI